MRGSVKGKNFYLKRFLRLMKAKQESDDAIWFTRISEFKVLENFIILIPI
jgi:hypothetical protein